VERYASESNAEVEWEESREAQPRLGLCEGVGALGAWGIPEMRWRDIQEPGALVEGLRMGIRRVIWSLRQICRGGRR